ncbi:hypothetical protein MVI01_58500 [Myxococcus virescens]|uniref:Uncharacterized protein n=1 Tax=Myxococcus virescens TaxID=83456 RepID=A0A511HKG5_9BACT|nr:hypothetical protein MVI01_58500 [Myxococcus virescens]
MELNPCVSRQVETSPGNLSYKKHLNKISAPDDNAPPELNEGRAGERGAWRLTFQKVTRRVQAQCMDPLCRLKRSRAASVNRRAGLIRFA